MRCPKCSSVEDKVIETRISKEGETIRRRRQCLNCQYRFTTYETILPAEVMVVKRDGRREEFSPEKLRGGIQQACWKRSVDSEAIDRMIGDITASLTMQTGEVTTKYIGELVMEQLAKIDEVAYVRFASVYRHFKDADQFINEIKNLSASHQ